MTEPTVDPSSEPLHAFEPDGTPSPGALLALNGKSDIDHTHAVDDVDGLTGRLGGIESRLGGAAVGATFVNNSETEVPSRVDTIPTGWELISGDGSAITVTSNGFSTAVPGLYLISMSGSYGPGPTAGAYEYRILKGSQRLMTLFGDRDVSSRSGTCAVQISAGDVIRFQYRQTSGETVALRPNSFNTATFARIA